MAATIQILDRTFKPYLPEEELQVAIRRMAKEIEDDYAEEKPLMLGILNGAFIFASDLIRCFDFPCEISFVKLQSYVGMQSSGKVTEAIGLEEEINGRSILIVEDIVDSGRTLAGFKPTLFEAGAKDVRIAALMVKPDAMQVDLKVDYRGFDIPNDFIVGYGMDYNGEGRNLRDIWVVNE